MKDKVSSVQVTLRCFQEGLRCRPAGRAVPKLAQCAQVPARNWSLSHHSQPELEEWEGILSIGIQAGGFGTDTTAE